MMPDTSRNQGLLSPAPSRGASSSRLAGSLGAVALFFGQACGTAPVPSPPRGASPSAAPTASPAATPTASPTPTSGGYPGPLVERAVSTYYFYWYDTQTGTHMDAVDPLTDHPPASLPITFRGTAWHRKQIEDALYAGVDVLLPVYWAGSEHAFWAEPGVVNLARALEEVRLSRRPPPALGMFYDTNSLQGLDLRTKAGRDTFYAGVRFFFRTVPTEYWAKVAGDRPAIWFFTAAVLGGYESGFLADLSARFERDFGVRPYIVLDRSWLQGEPDLVGWDSTYSWGGIPPAFSAKVAEVSPGYDERAIPGREGIYVPRENGDFYRRGLTEAVIAGAPWLAIETWNEFHEVPRSPRRSSTGASTSTSRTNSARTSRRGPCRPGCGSRRPTRTAGRSARSSARPTRRGVSHCSRVGKTGGTSRW